MRFSILQLMGFAVLAALFAGLFAAAREHGGVQDVYHLEFTRDGDYLIGAHSDELLVWKRTGDSYQRLSFSRQIDGFYTPYIWEVERDGERSLVFATYSGGTRLEEFAIPFTGTPRRTAEIPHYSDEISLSADGERFISRRDQSIELRSWEAKEPVTTITVSPDWPSGTAISPDGKEIIHTDMEEMRVWRAADGKLLRKEPLPEVDGAYLSDVKYSPDGRYLCLNRNDVLEVYDAGTLKPVDFTNIDGIDLNRNGMWPWELWLPGSPSTLVSFKQSNDEKSMYATLLDVHSKQVRHLTVELSPAAVRSYWVSSVAVSPDLRWCVMGHSGQVELIDLENNQRRKIFYPRPLLFTVIYGGGFLVWAVCWGRMSRRMSQQVAFSERETQVRDGAVSGAFQMIGEVIVIGAIVGILVCVAVCTASALDGFAFVVLLIAVVPAVAFALYQGNFMVLTRPAGEGGCHGDQHAPVSVPPTIVAIWIASGLAGLVAIAAPIGWIMASGFIWYPFWYYSIVVGVMAVAQASGCSVNRLMLTAWLQLGCLLTCDPVNFLVGCSVLVLLQRPDVREFYQQVAKRREQLDSEGQQA